MLSPCFGPSPATPKNMDAITRGYIVYIEITNRKILRIRQFYCDYEKENGGLPISNQPAFEQKVIALSSIQEVKNQGNLTAFNRYYVKNPPIPPSNPPRPFPYIFCDNIDEVHFGNVPCHVTYIFNTPFFKFLNTASDPADRPLDNEQPMVLRSSKMIRDQSGKFIEKSYGYPNDTFFNLEVVDDPSDKYSLMRFDNIMYGSSYSHNKEYCMDIYFDAPTDKWQEEIADLLANFVDKLKSDNVELGKVLEADCEKSFRDSIREFVEDLFDSSPGIRAIPTNWVTMVFDPPQTNGGTGGPPN